MVAVTLTAVKCRTPNADELPVQGSAATTPSSAAADGGAERWRARPKAALAIRIALRIAPFAASVGASFVLALWWRRPPGVLAGAGWWLALMAVGTAALVVVERIARRLLPLSTLLRMSLTFPDEKPSRFGLALRTGTTKQLERRLADVRERGLGATEREAAWTLLQLVAALQDHDRLTRGHGERVRAYSALIGERMGLDADDLSKLQWAGLIHDVGKLAVPSDILNKPGRLTAEEFEIVKTHPAEGMALVGPLAGWLGEWVQAVGDHHERWDGGGYPNGLAGADISLAGRIVAVADVFDVITAARSYKTPQSPHEARAELARHAGTQFDPTVVRAFLEISLGDLRKSVLPMSWAAQVPAIGATIGGQVAGWLAPALLAMSTAVAGGGLAEAAGQPRVPGPSIPPSDVGVVRSDESGDVTDDAPDAGERAETPSPPVSPPGDTDPNPDATTPGTPSPPPTDTLLPPATTLPEVGVSTTLPPIDVSTTLPTLTVPTVPTTIPLTIPTIPLTVPTTLPPLTVPTTLPPLTVPTTLPPLPTVPPLPTTTLPSLP